MNPNSSAFEESKPEGRSVLYKEPSEIVGDHYGVERSLLGSSAWPKPVIKSFTIDSKTDNNLKSYDAISKQLSPIQLPEHYSVGQSSFSFESKKTATILKRLTTFIQRTSSDFQVYPSEGRVDCKPQGMVSFRIILWSRDQDEIVLEIQRQNGCSLLLQRYRRILTRFLSEGTDFNPDSLTPSLPKMTIPNRDLSLPVTEESAGWQTTIQKCHEMLKDSNQESKLLALENLVFLQSECCTSAVIADQTAHYVLGSSDDAEDILLHSSFAQCFGAPFRGADHGLSEDRREYSQGKYFGLIHHMALKVLAVALDRESRSPSSLSKVDIASDSWQTILEALWHNVLNSLTQPREASLSAHCLVCLDDVGSNHEALEYSLQNSQQLLPAIFEAQQFASKCNLTLEKSLRDLSERIQMAL